MGKSSSYLAPIRVGKRVFVIGVGMTKVTGLGRDTLEGILSSTVGIQLPSSVATSRNRTGCFKGLVKLAWKNGKGGASDFASQRDLFIKSLDKRGIPVPPPPFPRETALPPYPSFRAACMRAFESTAPVPAVFFSTFRKGFTIAFFLGLGKSDWLKVTKAGTPARPVYCWDALITIPMALFIVTLYSHSDNVN